MNRIKQIPWISLCLWAILSVYALAGVRNIPFHPDEVSLLYQSQDLEVFFTQPISLAWQPGQSIVNDYRLLNPPLAKYILGFWRLISGYPSATVSIDWDWAKTFAENQEIGALPPQSLLWSTRFGISLLLPFSLFFIYKAGRILWGEKNGLVAMFLLGTNALVLIHTRRAMSEGVLLFTMTLSILGFLVGDKRPWLAGIGVALALSTKQTAVALIPAGLLAVTWLPERSQNAWRKIALNASIYLAVIGIVFLTLNPVLWQDPIQATQAMWQSRTAWARLQVTTLRGLERGDRMLQTPGERIASQLFDLFINPPHFYEVGNYAQVTQQAEQQYMAVFGNDLFRGLIGGGIMLTLCLLGIIFDGNDALKSSLVSIRTNRKKADVVGKTKQVYPNPRIPPEKQRMILLLILATASQALLLVTVVFLPAQRYMIPLVPFTCLWIASCITRFSDLIKLA